MDALTTLAPSVGRSAADSSPKGGASYKSVPPHLGEVARPKAVTEGARARIARTAQDFEASFLSTMLGQMFEGVQAGAFGGGEGEAAFQSFLTDAFAKSMARRGGVGVSKAVQHEMLKMQGLN